MGILKCPGPFPIKGLFALDSKSDVYNNVIEFNFIKVVYITGGRKRILLEEWNTTKIKKELSPKSKEIERMFVLSIPQYLSFQGYDSLHKATAITDKILFRST